MASVTDTFHLVLILPGREHGRNYGSLSFSPRAGPQTTPGEIHRDAGFVFPGENPAGLAGDSVHS